MKRMIKGLKRLSRARIEEIRALEAICNEYDGTKRQACLSTADNFDRNIRSFFLYYNENGELLAAAILFVPSDSEAEVTAFTHPSHRRRGLFSSLKAAAEKELEAFGIENVLYVAEPSSPAGPECLEAMGARQCNSELLMEFTPSEKNKVFSEVCCKTEISVEPVPSDEEYYYVRYEGREVGRVGVAKSGTVNCIFDLEIYEAERGRGLGKALAERLTEIFYDGKQRLLLQVSGMNDRAVHIYREAGFRVIEQLNYYMFE